MKTRPSRGKGREALLTESLRLFASRGVEAVSVRDIAASTGLSNPALFRHFESKEALAAVLFEQCYRRLVSALDQASRYGMTEWLEAALCEISRAPEGVLFVLDNLKRYWSTLPADLKARPLPSLGAALVDRERQAGRMRSDVAPQLIVTVVFGALGQIARSVHFYDSEIEPRTLAAELADLIIRGTAARIAPQVEAIS